MNARLRFALALTLFIAWVACLGYLGAVSGRPAPALSSKAQEELVQPGADRP